jgi:hypothetical protein
MMDRKGQDFSTSKIITIILVLLVIVLVLFFLYRAQIISYIRNLPSYSSENKDRIIPFNTNDKVSKEALEKLCPVSNLLAVVKSNKIVLDKNYYWDSNGVNDGDILILAIDGNYLRAVKTNEKTKILDGALILYVDEEVYLCKE